MPRLCTYTVTTDTGLAPNPYWGWCTLAVCTPNHQGARVREADWIAGFLSKARKHALLYAMELKHVRDMGDYYNDERFRAKRPNLRGSWQERCGDNFYERLPSRDFKQHRNRFHRGENFRLRDTRRPKVFIAKRFWYFGKVAKPIPIEFAALIPQRGIRINHDPMLVARFIVWVQTSFREGIHGEPNDNPDIGGQPGAPGAAHLLRSCRIHKPQY